MGFFFARCSFHHFRHGPTPGSAPKLRVFCAATPFHKTKSKSYQLTPAEFDRLTKGYMVYNETPHRIAFTTSGGEIGNAKMSVTDMVLESYQALDQFADTYLPGKKIAVKVKKKVGKEKFDLWTVQESQFKPGDVLPLYYMWDQRRMIFTMEQRFSDNLLCRVNPNYGKDPFQ